MKLFGHREFLGWRVRKEATDHTTSYWDIDRWSIRQPPPMTSRRQAKSIVRHLGGELVRVYRRCECSWAADHGVGGLES